MVSWKKRFFRVGKIDNKIDELRPLLEDIFLTAEGSILLKETNEIVREKRFDEKSPNEVQSTNRKMFEFLEKNKKIRRG